MNEIIHKFGCFFWVNTIKEDGSARDRVQVIGILSLVIAVFLLISIVVSENECKTDHEVYTYVKDCTIEQIITATNFSRSTTEWNVPCFFLKDAPNIIETGAECSLTHPAETGLIVFFFILSFYIGIGFILSKSSS